jgi:hypothetical protein
VTASWTKAMPRSSSSLRSLSRGSMTTMRDLSYLKWRSMSGSVPRPIEPKPIMTIGPVISLWTGQFCFAISRKLPTKRFKNADLRAAMAAR